LKTLKWKNEIKKESKVKAYPRINLKMIRRNGAKNSVMKPAHKNIER